MEEPIFVLINHAAFKNSPLNLEEYSFCDLIYRQQNNPSNEVKSWFNVVKDPNHNYLSGSRTTVVRRKKKLVNLGFLEQHSSKTNCVRVSKKWINEIVNFKES